MAIKKIKNIYPKYFQKSKVFLYPILGHKKGSGVTPIQTFMSWDGVFTVDDNKLACLFHLRNDEEFIRFEERFLYGHPLFDEYIEVEENKAVYIFDLSSCGQDFQHVKNGQYSKLSKKTKEKIADYEGKNTGNYAFVDTYLYPEKYFEQYAGFLCPKKEDIPEMKLLLEEVGELCSLPDLEQEELKMKVKTLQLGN